ncbi:hypothetical protein QL285_076606 [Trifolium repens]|nr:hypothetical protein QL285_076606 [Trifolium repens]
MDIMFTIMEHISKEEHELFCVILWSLWKNRNNKVWNNFNESCQAICDRASWLLMSWKNAQQTRSRGEIRNMPQVQASLSWSPPSQGRYKCNVDASFSVQRNKVGIGMCIRDDQGRFVLAKTEWIAPCIDVELGEALGLLSALQWVNDLHLHNMDFEMDSKRVVDCLYSDIVNVSELGAIINDCRHILATDFVNSHVKFIWRQVNEVAHFVARVAPLLASFHIFSDIPTCIQIIIVNEMR